MVSTPDVPLSATAISYLLHTRLPRMVRLRWNGYRAAKDRTFHDLRRTAVTRLAIAGCTEAEIKSITRHSISEIRDILETHYLYLDPQIAINAIRKLENSTSHLYVEFVRQLLERRLEETKSGTRRPTERPTEVTGSRFVRSKA